MVGGGMRLDLAADVGGRDRDQGKTRTRHARVPERRSGKPSRACDSSRRSLRRDQAPVAPGAERLEGGRAAARPVSRRGAVESDGDLQTPGVRVDHLRARPMGAEAAATVAHDLDLHAVEAPRARDGVLAVGELEGAAVLLEVGGRDARAEDVRAALRAELQEDVLFEGVHREAGAGEHAAQGQPGRAAVRPEAARLQRHGEGARLLAARRVLEVGEAVAVVVDAVAANLGWSRFRLGAGIVIGVNAHAATAGVVGAGVVVVALDEPIEGVAGRAAGDKGVLADAGVTGIGGAGVPVVAAGVRRAATADGDIAADPGRVARVGRAGILVVAVGGRRAALAALERGVGANGAVAGVEGAGVLVVAVGGGRADRAAGDRGVGAGARRGVARARRVALVEGGAGDGVADAAPALAGVGLRAGVAVVARRPIGRGGVGAGARRGVARARRVALIEGGAADRGVLADARIAGIRGARVVVVAVGGRRADLAAGDGRVGAGAGAAGVRRTSVPVVAVGRSRTVWLDVDAALARVPAGAVLIAVVHHELQAVGVPRDHLPGGHQVVHVPAYLGAPALVAEARRSGIAAAEVPVVLHRVGVVRDGDERRRSRLVDGPNGALPRAEDGVRRNRRPARLPIAGLAARSRGGVGDEERGKHRPVAQVGIAGALRRVGARQVSVERGRADLGIEHASGIRGERREGEVRGPRAG